MRPAQQVAEEVQGAPRGSQVVVVPPPPVTTVAAQRSTPLESGTQGEPLQHWSLNWQTCPAMMQQPGVPLQPVGHAAVIGPPKQRMIPDESGLQTEWPGDPPWVEPSAAIQQQFWEAFTVPPPPQMLPGGLQLWPPEQVGGEEEFFCEHVTP